MILSVPIYASHGASEGVSIPAKPSNDVIYYYPLPIDYNQTSSSNKTTQSITANATTESRTSIETSPQPTTPTTPVTPTTATAEQKEGQTDTNYKPIYTPPENTPAVIADGQQSAIEQEESQIGSPQTNQVSIPSTPSTVEERREAVMAEEGSMDRCDELKNTNTLTYTDEQLRIYKKEMEEVCTPDPDIPHEDAIRLPGPQETEADAEREYSLLRKILNFFTPEEKEEFKKSQGLGINFTKLEETEETAVQETTAKEPEKEEGGGLIASFIARVFSLFR